MLRNGVCHMERKPDVIRAVLLIFAIGLVISGFTSIRTADDGAATAPVISEAPTPADSRLTW